MWIELSQAKQIEHSLSIKECSVTGQRCRRRRLGQVCRGHTAVNIHTLAIRPQRAAVGKLAHLNCGHSCILSIGNRDDTVLFCSDLPQIVPVAHGSTSPLVPKAYQFRYGFDSLGESCRREHLLQPAYRSLNITPTDTRTRAAPASRAVAA